MPVTMLGLFLEIGKPNIISGFGLVKAMSSPLDCDHLEVRQRTLLLLYISFSIPMTVVHDQDLRCVTIEDVVFGYAAQL